MVTSETILIEKDTLPPESFQVEDDPQPNPWPWVKYRPIRHGLEKDLANAGWTFFYMANVVRATVFGFNQGKMIDTALNRLIAQVKLQGCNCLEIQDVRTHSFLGLPYVSVSGHPRHIQRGLTFAVKGLRSRRVGTAG